MAQRRRLESFVLRATGFVASLSLIVLFLIGAMAHARQGSQSGSGGAGTLGVRLDSDDIGGVVTSSKAPEAGVWVIAETHDLPVRFIKIVVTDDRGRYLIPELPKATY